jgi:hypothetical protein
MNFFKSSKSYERSQDFCENKNRSKYTMANLNKSDERFAKKEIEKLTESSSDKLNDMKAKISEYQAAKLISDEKANNTEIGRMLNDPHVWNVIARKIMA